jgi:ribose/xylose/arabinose/galactoside ABC-type transport system permease subunit
VLRIRYPQLRALILLALTILGMMLLDIGHGRFLAKATAFTALQQFATLGPVALGLGLTMIIREFDLSVAGMFGMAGCVAVLTGVEYPALGLSAAVAVGAIGGAAQGLLITRLRLGSISVTLAGLLLFVGIAYVLTQSHSIGYDNIDFALSIDTPIIGVFSVRSLVAIGVFAVGAVFVSTTRIGRDMIAMGSDRRAAIFAGVNVDRLLIGTFALSGMLAALAGALLSFGLASASPSGLSDVLVPATAAAILGGVSLSGGVGRPLGIAAGVLSLAVLRSGLNGLGASAAAHDIVIGAILLGVAIIDGGTCARYVAIFRIGAKAT